jgi:hypothetical protein
MADNTRQKTVVITDYDYDDVDIERTIIEEAGLRLATAQCKTEDDVIEAARDADAMTLSTRPSELGPSTRSPAAGSSHGTARASTSLT